MPVPIAKDTGTAYKEHVVSSGPYMFESIKPGARMTLVRNPNWDPATDPNRSALPDRIEVALNVNSDDIDNQLISGDLDVGVEGRGSARPAQGRILADPALRANVDSAPAALLWYTALSASVPPLDNIDCRKAVLYAADRTGYQRAHGGETGGEIATNLLPPVIAGAQRFDLYPTPNNAGDPARHARRWPAAAGPTASRPPSPTARSSPTSRRRPRRSSSRSPGSASRCSCGPTRPATTTGSTPGTRRSSRRTTSA